MHAIAEGRKCAAEVDEVLMTTTRLPWQGAIAKRSWIPPPVRDSKHVWGGTSSASDSASERPGMDAESVSVTA